MPSKKIVLFIGTVFPEPVDTGKKVVLSGLIRYFREHFGDDRFTYACIGPVPQARHRESWIAVLQLPSVLKRLAALLIHTFLNGRLSLQEGTLYSAELKRQIHDLILKKKPDVVVFDTIRVAQFGVPNGYAGDTVVYLEDLFSLRYRNMLQAASSSPDALRGVLGNFAKFLPAQLASLIDRSQYAKKALLRFESSRTALSERREAARASACLLLNHNESAMLQTSVPGSQQITIKPLMTVAAGNRQVRSMHSLPLFVFLGTLTIPQNSVAIETFIQTCWADVLRRIPHARLMIIGGGRPSPVLISCATQYQDSIELAGFIAEIEPILSGCCAMIVPLLFGSGVKLKIIEALAHGVPIVSTPVGVEGTPLVHGENCLIAQDIAQLPQLMASLVEPQSNLFFSTAARSVYETSYAPAVVVKEYARIFPPE